MREIVLDTETTGLDPLGRSDCLTNGNESGGTTLSLTALED